jgi:hypothetical protein
MSNDPTSNRRASRLNRLLATSAATLLAGILLFCHCELRRSQYMVDIQANPLSNEEQLAEVVSQHEAFLASIDHEAWLSFRLLIPIGAGALVGSLITLTVIRQFRFSIRTLLLVTTYLGLLVGIPLGVVRPRLQNPRVWPRLNNPDIGFGQARAWPQPGSDGPRPDPWGSGVTRTVFEFPLFNRNDVFVALAACMAVPLTTFLSMSTISWLVRLGKRSLPGGR